MMLQENLKTVFGQPSYAWRRKWQPTPVFLPGDPHVVFWLLGLMKEIFLSSQVRQT